MTLAIANVGGTLTGGATENLTQTSTPVAGKASFVTDNHTRLAGRLIDIYSSPASTTKTDAGVARGGAKITFSDRLTEEGCCTVQAGSVIIDVNVRWSLNQPEALVDEAFDWLPALVSSPAFVAAVKRGVLPA